jgi:hypothetical protein
MLIVLRLADQKDPVMDKLYFYIRRMDKTLEKSKQILDGLHDRSQGQLWLNISSLSEDGVIIDEEDSTDESELKATIHDSSTEDSDTESKLSLGNKVIDIWKKRREKLVTDFAIAGWLLSPIPEVYEDSRLNMTGEHRDAVDRLLKKMMGAGLADDSDELAAIMYTFWSEFEQFKTKSGHFAKSYIWNPRNTDIVNGRSHFWHRTNSFFHTEVLGKFACRVCSKIVGMGSAERNWGDVKHLKSDKRAHMSAAAVQKQATIFGASCMADAALERKKAQKVNTEPYKFWDETDFDSQFDMLANKDTPKVVHRILKCYFEDWEEEHLRKNDDVSHQKFLQKYGGLEFVDIDNGRFLKIDKTEMFYERKWMAAAVQEDGKEEPWLIGPGCALHDCLQMYYAKHPEKNVKVVLRKSQLTDVGDVDISKNKKSDVGNNEKSPKKRKSLSSTNNKKDPPNSTEAKRTRSGTKDTLSACGGCGLPVAPVHKCDMCQRSMHPFCGRTIGEEGYGSTVRCKKCDGKD